MGWLTRVVVVAATFGVGCASLAGIDDGPTMSEDALSSGGGASSGSSGTSSGASGASSGSSGPGSSGDSGSAQDTGAPRGDAAKDATPTPACALPNGADNAACTAGSTCCSGKCAEDRRCVNDCKGAGSFNFCEVGADDCCIGNYCSLRAGVTGFVCAKCIPDGSESEGLPGDLRARSCCSNKLNGTLCGPPQ